METPPRDTGGHSWRAAAPVAAGIGGILFLAMSARAGYSFRVARLAKEVAAEAHKSADSAHVAAASLQLKSMDARKLAVQALVRGSLAAAFGFGVFGGAVAVSLNTYSVSAFVQSCIQNLCKHILRCLRKEHAFLTY
jgi:hypothetical protein